MHSTRTPSLVYRPDHPVMNVIAEIQRINQAELDNGSVGTSASWHAKYADSAWVFVGNLPMQLTEGDVICVMSQFGEVEDINLVRDEDTGKSKGFAFLKYEDARSCILAVDNLTGSKILGRSIRVDHVENYRLPKHLADKESGENGNGSNIDKTAPGHAYQGQELASSFDISQGQDLFGGPPVGKSAANSERVNGNGEEDISKEERRQAKRARKEARDEKRREKEQRRMRKEEKRRERRARKMKGDSGESASNDDEYGDSRGTRRKDSSKRDKKRKHRRRGRSSSRSRSYNRYSSDEGSLSSNGSANKRKRDRRER